MYLLGMDVSKWQDDNSTPQMMDFNKAKTEGINFTFIKASQNTWLDQDFTYNWNNAKLAGILRGGYHYFDVTKSGIEQARFFAGILRNDPGELPPVVDFEQRKYDVSMKEIRRQLYIFLITLKDELKINPIIYTSPGYWNEFGSREVVWTNYSLWIAHYGVSTPTVPQPWSRWYFWQFTDKGDGKKYGAESNFIDLNYFNNVDYLLPTKTPENIFENPIDVSGNKFPMNVKTISTLNIRTKASLDSSTKIGAVKKGTELEVIGETEDWYKGTCYFSKKYTERV